MTNTIEIQECYGEHTFSSSKHCGLEIHEAVEKAVAKRYGKAAFFVPDNGLRDAWPRVRFGQVFKPIKGDRTGTLTSVTGRICITVR